MGVKDENPTTVLVTNAAGIGFLSKFLCFTINRGNNLLMPAGISLLWSVSDMVVFRLLRGFVLTGSLSEADHLVGSGYTSVLVLPSFLFFY